MFGEEKNLRDDTSNYIKDSVSALMPYKGQDSIIAFYPKLKKLITALYIVTDIIEKDEPIRAKLRTLGLEIISDINLTSRTELNKRTESILSILDIAVSIKLISEMNFNILKKEFSNLSELLKENKESNNIDDTWLKEFLDTPEPIPAKSIKPIKGPENKDNFHPQSKDFHHAYLVKKERREDIIKAIKTNGGSATITEVKDKATGALLDCSEKTLQRELVSMSKEGILNKTGEKRWSKYSLI